MNFKIFLLTSFFIVLGQLSFNSSVNACVKKRFYIEEYGAVGDGRTNDIAAFQALTRDVNANGGGIVVFPENKVFSITIDDDFSSGHKSTPDDGAMAFNFEHCKKVVVDMNGCIISLTPNHSTRYSFFRFFDCASFSLSNGTIEGDVEWHDYSPVIYKGKEEKSSHQWGYGVYIRGSKGEIKDMKISRMTGDGIYFGSVKLAEGIYHAKVEISGCEISFCRRNGISCASSLGFFLTGTTIHHIGDWAQSADMPVAIEGCKPKAGIDFEYEGKAGDVGDVEISGCSFRDCTDYCIVTSNTNKPETTIFILKDSEFCGSAVHTNNLISRGKKEIRDCRFDDAGFFLGDAKVHNCIFDMGVVMNYVSRTFFYDCEFNGKIEQIGEKKGCFMAGTNMDKTLFQRCRFKNIKGYNDYTPAFQGFSGYVHPVNIDFVACEFDNCSFVLSQKNYESYISFKECVLRNGCLIHNMGTKAIDFEASELYDVESYATQNGQFKMVRCKIIQEDASVARPLLAFGTHTLSKCSVIDKVGITSAASRKYGVKEYRISADNTDIQLSGDNKVTRGLSLKGGRIEGVRAVDFGGEQVNTVFK